MYGWIVVAVVVVLVLLVAVVAATKRCQRDKRVGNEPSAFCISIASQPGQVGRGLQRRQLETLEVAEKNSKESRARMTQRPRLQKSPKPILAFYTHALNRRTHTHSHAHTHRYTGTTLNLSCIHEILVNIFDIYITLQQQLRQLQHTHSTRLTYIINLNIIIAIVMIIVYRNICLIEQQLATNPLSRYIF